MFLASNFSLKLNTDQFVKCPGHNNKIIPNNLKYDFVMFSYKAQ